MYVIGGQSKNKALSTVEVFDTEADVWSELPDMDTKREASTGHVFGGHDGHSRHSSCEVFDISTNTWSLTPKKEERKIWCCCCVNL